MEELTVITKGRVVGRARLTGDNTLEFLSTSGRVSLRALLEKSDDMSSAVLFRKVPSKEKPNVTG